MRCPICPNKREDDETCQLCADTKEVPANCTCLKCAAANVCECAFDPYNTDGDCMESK